MSKKKIQIKESNLRLTHNLGPMILLGPAVVIFLFSLSINCTVLSAQTLSIAGQIIDDDSKERLPYANVLIKGTAIGTQTNLEGFFLIHNVPDTVFVIQVSYMGYTPREISVDPTKESTGLLITLKQSPISVEGVTVSAEQSNFIKTEKTPGLTTISPLQIATLPSVGQADIFRSL